MRRAQKNERETTKAIEQSAAAKKAEEDAHWAAHGDGKKSKRTRIEPQPVRGYVEEDVDVERPFERNNSKWGKKSIDG